VNESESKRCKQLNTIHADDHPGLKAGDAHVQGGIEKKLPLVAMTFGEAT
jgi:hypothetical protein